MISIACPGGEYLLENGILNNAAKLISNILRPQKALVLSDSNVFPLYGEKLLTCLKAEGINCNKIIFPAGEESKSLGNAENIFSFLSENNYSRSDVLIALGGGVIGDLGGFAASCFKRGMKLVQLPASLLAMVDSSVGGKTAVNLPGAKNQVGSFYQPSLTLADPLCLNTLPEREYRCGCGEIIKYAILFDAGFFHSLLRVPVRQQYDYVIKKCVEFKRDVVLKDEHDTGLRQLLNFGHTIGHAAEVLSSYSLAHGEAVAVGMAKITELAVNMGLCDSSSLSKILGILEKYELPVSCNYSGEELYSLISKDKKVSGGIINLIVPREIGKCEILKMSGTELYSRLCSGGKNEYKA